MSDKGNPQCRVFAQAVQEAPRRNQRQQSSGDRVVGATRLSEENNLGEMAGSYTKKEFGVGPEEQTLLKDSNGTRIVPSKGKTRQLFLCYFRFPSFFSLAKPA